MTVAVTHFGVVYDEHTNWREFLRHVPARGLNVDRHVGLSVPDAIGELSEALRGTPMQVALADAALEVVENGPIDAMDLVESAGWEKAPNGFERMLAIVARSARRVSDLWVYRLYRAMFELAPNDHRLLATFTRDIQASKGADLRDYLVLVATYNVDWLVGLLPLLRPPADLLSWKLISRPGMKGKGLSADELPTLDENRAKVLTAIATLGISHIKALVEKVGSLPVDSVREQLVLALRRHPHFAAFAPP